MTTFALPLFHGADYTLGRLRDQHERYVSLCTFRARTTRPVVGKPPTDRYKPGPIGGIPQVQGRVSLPPPLPRTPLIDTVPPMDENPTAFYPTRNRATMCVRSVQPVPWENGKIRRQG